MRALARLLKYLVLISVTLCLALAVFVWLALEPDPVVFGDRTPTPEDVNQTRNFVHGVRAAIDTNTVATETFSTNEAQLNSVIRLGARFIPGFRGEVDVGPTSVIGLAAVPVPLGATPKWLNVRVVAPEFADRLSFSNVDLGQFALPPGLALEAGRIGANLFFGNALGDTALNAASAMRIDDDAVSFDLAMEQMGKNGLMRGFFGSMRGSEMPTAQEIDYYFQSIRQAMLDGTLPAEGSFLPYLRYTLGLANARLDAEGVGNAYTSAVFALARLCGALEFTTIVGGVEGGELVLAGDPKADCTSITFNGRVDSKRHFITAAALQAASNRGFAVSVGEFKELYDTLKSGGFDFTDIAANNSGIRLSNTFMAAMPQDWPVLLERLAAENDVIITYEGIPQIMSGEDFAARFGDVDSPGYKAMYDVIESRIDTLPLHAPLPPAPGE
ncbi:MAG: hypothetical protein AAGF79_19005 [Pseudomonadota bacterium]